MRDLVREILSRPEFAPTETGDRDRYRAQVLEWAKTLAAEGGTALGFPVEFGGGGDVGASVASFETLALGDLSLLVKVGVQFGLFGGAVLQLGTRAHHQAYLADIATLELPGCFAMTESGHGSNVQEIRTVATYDAASEEFVINTPEPAARKDYIGNAARDGRMAVVFCQLVVGNEPRGVHALLVPLRDGRGRILPRIEIEDCGAKQGLNGVDNGRISFDHARVPRGALLDRYAEVSADGRYASSIENPTKRFFTMLGTLIQGRVCICAAGISTAKVALTIAIRHAAVRRQFGPPGGSEVTLLEYPTHQRRLLPPLAKTYALSFAQQQLAAALHESFSGAEPDPEARRELETRAAGLKAYATWHATATIQDCREACGGAGYMSINRFGALKADSDVFTTFEGDNTVLMQLVAKSLLTDYREQFGEFNPLEMVGFMAGQVLETVIERTAAREIIARLADDLLPSRESETDLLDRDYHLALMLWREEHVLSGLARRLKEGMDNGEGVFELFLRCQPHMIVAAHAHIERLVLEAMIDGVGRAGDGQLAELLGRVCDLFALSAIEADRAWYQEHGRLSSTRSKAVIRAVERLARDLSADALLLVDAFGIPDQALGAPIGQRDADGSTV